MVNVVDPKILNVSYSKIWNILNADMMPQVKNPYEISDMGRT